MRVVWLAKANEDRVAIYDYIEQSSPSNAASVDEEFLHAAQLLGRFPELGRRGKREGIREWALPRIGYIFFYRINHSTLEIVALVRSKRNRGSTLPQL